MSVYILYNDELLPSQNLALNHANRSFKFGDGLFESMRMANGQLNFANEHADRLAAGMKALGIDGHKLIDAYFLKQITAELKKKNKMGDNLRFRLTIYRDGEGLYTPSSNKFGYLLECSPLTSAEYELNKKGLVVDVYQELPKPVNFLSNFKTTSALLYVMAGLYQKHNRLDESLLLNQNRFLCESTASNIFVVYQNQIYTPALSEGCVAGVMRSVVLQLAKLNHLPVIEAQINPNVLLEAEEVFLTNAVSGVRWVIGFGGKRYFNAVSKKIASLLNTHISK